MNAWVNMLIVLFAAPAIIFVTHTILTRISRISSAQMIALRAVIWGYVPTFIFLWLFSFRVIPSRSETALAAFYCFIVYSLLGNTYFHFFNMSETARRIRILYEIYKAGSLPSDEVAALYKTTDIISVRLRRLVALKQLRCSDGYYSISGQTLYRAGMLMLLWRKILRLDEDAV